MFRYDSDEANFPTFIPGEPTPCFHFEAPQIRATERVLAETFQAPVLLGACERIYANSEDKKNLRRCFVAEGPLDAPASLIFKRFDCFEAYDPEDVHPVTPAWRCFNEWAATRFLHTLPHTPPFAPRCYGGDRARGFLLLEDIGRGHEEAVLGDEENVLLSWTVAAHLRGNDPAHAEAGLLAYAAILGRMHAATIGKEEAFQQQLVSLAPRNTDYRLEEAQHFQRDVEVLRVLSATLGVSWHEVAEEAEAVRETMRAPGPYLAFTHGEYCPNELYFEGRVRLYDFEYSGYRHALTDGIYRRQLLPWCRHRLPENLLQRMEAVYREALQTGCPAAAEESGYRRTQAEAWVWRDVFQLAFQLPQALETNAFLFHDDVKGEGETAPSARQRVLLVLDGLATMTEQQIHLPAFGRWAREMAVRLRFLWNPEPFHMPLYPAFG
jgi:hypothetical protein